MTKREYADEIARVMNAEVREIEKNGVICTGISVDIGGNVSPCVYIDEAYDNEKTIEEAIDMVNEIVTEAKNIDVNIDAYSTYEKAKDLIKVRLYNKKNAGDVYEIGTDYGFKDLALIPYIEGIDISNDKGSIKITEELLDLWGVDKNEVITQGISNLKYRIMSLAEMIGLPEGMFPMMVVTNMEMYYGASSIIPAAKELTEMFSDGYVVLPSSIHEVIVVPKDVNTNINGMIGMVKEINATAVAPKDKLSDNVYEF